MKYRAVTILFCMAVVMCPFSGADAQQNKPRPKIIAFGSDSPERGTTRVGYWNNEKNMGAGQFAIDYGRPVWRKEYEDTANFDKVTKGKVEMAARYGLTDEEVAAGYVLTCQSVPLGEGVAVDYDA